jgi:hypothetical protein
MAKHRSLSNALLTPEKLAFIKGQEETPIEPQPKDPSESHDASQSVSKPKPNDSTNTTVSKSITRNTPSLDRRVSVAEVVPDNDAYRIAITTRLKPRTADALRRAHLEQKLNRREPATQQEIIESAVQYWLREHSYLD